MEPRSRTPRARLFRAEHGWIENAGAARAPTESGGAGPLIVEEYDATCLVPPGARAELDAGGNIVIELSNDQFRYAPRVSLPAANCGSHSAICGQSDRTTIISSIVMTNGEAPMITSSILPRLRRPCTT